MERYALNGAAFLRQAGLLRLPDELHLEVIDCFPAIPIPTENPGDIDCNEHLNRRQALISLSQTCRSLRRVFLPLLWNRIEVFRAVKGRASIVHQGDQYRSQAVYDYSNKIFASCTRYQLDVVTARNPSLASHVNILNVMLTEHCIEETLQLLAESLAILPKLHTVQLQLEHYKTTETLRMVERIFRGRSYPQINILAVTFKLKDFVAACPNLRQLFCLSLWSCGTCMRTEVYERTPHLEMLGPPLVQYDLFSSIAQTLPKLRELVVYGQHLRLGFAQFNKLSNLPDLRTINMDLSIWHPGSKGITKEEEHEWIGWARTVLLKIQEGYQSTVNQEWRINVTCPHGTKRAILV